MFFSNSTGPGSKIKQVPNAEEVVSASVKSESDQAGILNALRATPECRAEEEGKWDYDVQWPFSCADRSPSTVGRGSRFCWPRSPITLAW
jgi:hypothetical protein